MAAGWTLIENNPTQGRTFKRPLDETEVWFLWDCRFNGASVGIPYCQLRLPNGVQDAHLFSEANIARAWVSTKRRYPLAGAIVRGADNAPLQPKEATGLDGEGNVDENGAGFTSEPHFIVRELDLSVLRPGEIVFGTIACAEEVQQQMTGLLTCPCPLSEDLLMKLYIFRETNQERADVLHLMIMAAHCVADRFAMTSFLRCWLDTLARGAESEPAQKPLEERLAMAIPSMDLEPKHLRSLSLAVRRWRRAIGMVIFQLKMAKRRGGHTLPCRLTRSTPYIPGQSDIVSIPLTSSQTATVIANCRLLDIKFGNAFLALAQVAMTRVLYRRYLRGEISEEEWAYRKRQPHNSGGPINLRPCLDKGWFKNGGAGEFMLSIAMFFYQLPPMAFNETERQGRHALSDGAPPFFDLLSFDQFLHRTGLVKKQTTDFLNHPLIFELARAATLDFIKQTRHSTLQWMKQGGATNHEDDEMLAVSDFPAPMEAFCGSSIGDLDLISPAEYPLISTHPLSPDSPIPHPFKAGYVTPPSPGSPASEIDANLKIRLENLVVHMRISPAELYLSAVTIHGRLEMFAFYDRNVFEEGVVREWLDEVREAVLWYLGQTHRSVSGSASSDEDGDGGRVAKTY